MSPTVQTVCVEQETKQPGPQEAKGCEPDLIKSRQNNEGIEALSTITLQNSWNVTILNSAFDIAW